MSSNILYLLIYYNSLWFKFIKNPYREFYYCWNKAAASQIFPVEFILFLFSDYCWEIVNILIYVNKYSEIIPCEKTYYETKSFKEDSVGSLISKHFQTGVRFSSWSRTLKLMALVKMYYGWNEDSHHWEDSRVHTAGMCRRYQQIFMLHSTVFSTERRTSGACNLGLILTFLFLISD